MKNPFPRAAYLLIALSSLYSVGLVFLRLLLTEQYRFFFLIWNLFLAWIPLVLAIYLWEVYRAKRWSLIYWYVSILWLLFLPNTFYIVTDFVHLRRSADISFWFDLVMIASFAWNGMLLGMLSLWFMHDVLEKQFGSRRGWMTVQGILILTSIGIYLGRFVRFNSWDVISSPSDLGLYLATNLVNPIENARSYALILYFFLFFSVAYTTIRTFRPSDD